MAAVAVAAALPAAAAVGATARSLTWAANFSPAAVNDSGVIVGGQFVYSDGTLQNLNTLIPAGSGSQIQSATSINDNGQISPTPTAPPPARPTPCC